MVACIMWSIYNVAGRATFPTSEQATLTLTIWAMALRLLQYLEAGVGGPFV